MITSITDTIDLVSTVVANHHKLVAYISYRLGAQLGVSFQEKIELEIAGSLHDIGGLTLIERLTPLDFDYCDNDFHAEKGYLLLSTLEQCAEVAKIIRYHHCKWQNGKCEGIEGEDIPFGSHILNLADRLSVLVKPDDDNILNSVDRICERINDGKGSVFHPQVVDVFSSYQ